MLEICGRSRWLVAVAVTSLLGANEAAAQSEKRSASRDFHRESVSIAVEESVESWLYAIDRGSSDGSGTLYRLGTTSAGGFVGTQVVGETSVEDVFDIAFIGQRLFGIGPGGATFGTNDNVLIEIDPASGAVTPIGTIDPGGDFNALVGEGPSTLIGATTTGEVWRLNPDALQATRLGSFGSGLDSSGDLAFSPSGILFGSATAGGADRLVRVNLSNGRASTVGSLLYEGVHGLAFHPVSGALLGLADVEDDPRLVSINTSSGAPTVIGRVISADSITGLAVSPLPVAPPCNAGSDAVFFEGGRFRVDACWRTSDGNSGTAKLAQRQGIGATMWFFNPNNPELFLKVLNACGPFDQYWVFVAGLTNVEVTIKVTDLVGNRVKMIHNPQGQTMASTIDTSTFDVCP